MKLVFYLVTNTAPGEANPSKPLSICAFSTHMVMKFLHLGRPLPRLGAAIGVPRLFRIFHQISQSKRTMFHIIIVHQALRFSA